jgi:hypothetical protein
MGVGLLTLSLAACSGAGEGEASESASPTSPAATSSGTSPSAPPDAATSPSADASTTASGSEPASESAAASGDVEAALKSVLGQDAQIVSGARLEELQQSSQGLTDAVEVTPAECAPDGEAATGDLPEGTDMTGGIRVKTTDAGVASDMLSVAVYPDAASASEAISDAEEIARTCSSFTVEIGEGLSTDATMEVADVEARGDSVLGITTTTTASIEGASLPAGAGTSTAITVYVQDGERLVTYSGTTAGSTSGGDPRTAADGVELIDALRAELDG